MTDLTSKVILAYPVVGCTVGCEFCYAKRMNSDNKYIPDFSKPTLLPDYEKQLTEYNGAVYMVTGMSDLSDWSEEWVRKILSIAYNNPQNQYLFLTKRPEKISFSCDFENVWLGVSVIDRESKSRIDTLRSLNFKNKFVAFEPIQEDLGDLDLRNIKWISICKEIGDRQSKVVPERSWIYNILKQARGPVLMKSSLREMMGDDFRQELPYELMRCISDNTISDTYLQVLGNKSKRKEEEYENS